MEFLAWLFDPQNNIAIWNEHLNVISFVFLVLSVITPLGYYLLPYKRNSELFRARIVYFAGIGIIALSIIVYILTVIPSEMYQPSDILKIMISYLINAIILILLLFLLYSYLPTPNFKSKKYFIRSALFFNII